MLREKADMGDPKAMSDLGATYFQGDELPRDHSTAFAWFERSATAGYTLAFVNLATCYREGLGCPKDERKAEGAYWFRRGAEAGSLECSYRWGVCCATGTGAERDFGNAAEAFRFAAERGHAGAALDLGHCLMNGLGIIGGAKKSMAAWYERAVALGVTDAAAALGRMHRDGVGGDETTRDLDEASKWFRISAAGGDDASAQAL
ncbi:predicted protein, partial [Micromonas commoda]